MRYLGIDYGTKRVGIALSDEAGTMGFPKGIVQNTPALIADLCTLIAAEGVGAVVIGESRTLQGGQNPVAAGAHALGDELSVRAGVPVFYESEVFTSEEARQAPGKMPKTRSPKSHVAIDDRAAAIILSSYLASHS